MKFRCGSVVPRVIVTLLLVLAVSPVTAPFLTFDLNSLPGEAASPGAALVESKKTTDPVVALADTLIDYVPLGLRAAVVLSREPQVHAVALLQIPLRI